MRFRSTKVVAALGAWLTFAALLACTPPPQSNATPAKKLNLAGLPNAGQVSATLYRGGQPEKNGYAEMKKLGIEIVVNFRDEKDKIEAERRIVESLGMRYLSVPWSSSRDPQPREIAAFLRLLRDNAHHKVFAHCRRGAERTGTMIAVYRIAFENWTPEQATREMDEFHFSNFWQSHLKRYVRNFPQELEKNPSFRALRPATARP